MPSTIPVRALADDLLEEATRNHAHRAARTISGGRERTMRQTLIALAAGAQMSEHASPGEATLFVVVGRVKLTAGDESWHLAEGEFIEIPPVRHAVDAVDGSVVLLTAVPEGHGSD